MSEERIGHGFMDLGGLPSWDRNRIGAISVAAAKDDPQETLQLALTEREVALFAYGNMILAFMHPEFRGVVGRANLKLMEVADAQKFLEFEPGELDDLAGSNDE